jgi:hypothetical protein
MPCVVWSMTRVLGIATALMCALAGGAVWSVASLYLRLDSAIFLLLIAALVAWVLRRHDYAHSWSGVIVALACTLLAFAYASYLLAAAKVASFLGLPLRSTLLAIGPDMATAVAWADFTAWQAATLMVACALAGWLVWRRPKAR